MFPNLIPDPLTGVLGFPSDDLLVRRTITILDNDQIKVLPTIPVEVVPSPGDGKRNSILFILLILDASAGAYTNVDAGGIVSVPYIDAGAPFAAGSEAHSANIFTDNDVNRPLLQLGAFFETPGYEYAYTANKALGVKVSNGVAGNFTGGNAANTLKIITYYTIEEL